MRGDLGIDQQRQLRDRHAQQRRRHLPEDAVHALVGPGAAQRRRPQPQARQHADASQRRHLHRQLQHAADHHPDRQRIDRPQPPSLELRPQQPGGGDHAQVQQHRRGGRHHEMLPRIQDARRQRHQRHAADVREHQPGHHHRGLLAVGRQARGHRPDQHRRADHAQGTHRHQRPQQHGGHRIDQRLRLLVTLGGPRSGQDRHEGLRERALGEEPPQQVRDAEGDLEGIGGRAGAEGGGNELLAHQPGDARGQRERRHDGGRTKQTHGWGLERQGSQVLRLSMLYC